MTTARWERSVADWVDDLAWHRHMFAQSRFRWLGEDVTTVALRYTRGRLEFTTLADLARLDEQLVELRDHILRLNASVAEPLHHVRDALPHNWTGALNAVGLSPVQAGQIMWAGGPPLRDRETQRVLGGIPWCNPLTEVWELLQLVGMYESAAAVLEDAVCDLAEELLQDRSAPAVAAHTVDRVPQQLQMRIEDNLEERGPAGDARRRPRQSYCGR